jgi:hypothetical protein
VKIQTHRGAQYVWGSGLADAISHSAASVSAGDEIVMRRVGRTPVNVTIQEQDGAGVRTTRKLVKQRTVWDIKPVTSTQARKAAVRVIDGSHPDPAKAASDHPEVRDTLLAMKAAQLLAEQRAMSDRSRGEFLGEVAARLRRTLEQGERPPRPSMRQHANDRQQVRAAERQQNPDQTLSR